MIIRAICRLAGQLKKQHMRRRYAEKTLHRLGLSRRQSANIARHIP